jgi:hypothetical protein
MGNNIPKYAVFAGIATAGFCLAISEYIRPSMAADKWSWLHDVIGGYLGINGKIVVFAGLGAIFATAAAVSYLKARNKAK